MSIIMKSTRQLYLKDPAMLNPVYHAFPLGFTAAYFCNREELHHAWPGKRVDGRHSFIGTGVFFGTAISIFAIAFGNVATLSALAFSFSAAAGMNHLEKMHYLENGDVRE
jgi:hypothetical protein